MPLPQMAEMPGANQPRHSFDLLRQLLAQQGEGQDISALNSQSGLELMQNPAMQGIDTSRLIEAMNQSRQGGNVDQMRALRGRIEGRNNPTELQERQERLKGLTTAERDEPKDPFSILTRALGDVNRRRAEEEESNF